MNYKTYNVVGLDGQEYQDIEYDLIREWYAARLVNEESLVFSFETGAWKKLSSVFNLAELNAAKNLLAQQTANQQNFNQPQEFNQPTNFDNPQNFNTQPYYEPAPAFGQQFAPQQNFNHIKPKSSSGWKIAVGIVSVVVVLFVGLVGGGAYFFDKIAQTQAMRQTSNAGREKMVADLKNYEIPGSEYVDEQSGAKIPLPKDWRMLKADNPLLPIYNRNEINAELAKDNMSEKMILATDKSANYVMLAEIINFPERIDNVQFFNQSLVFVEEEVKKQSVPGSYKRISEETLPLSGGLAKKIVYEKVSNVKNPKAEEYGIGSQTEPIKGQIIVLPNDYHAVVLQMWAKKSSFDNAVADFEYIEKNFSMPKPKLR